jgi:uncharacterized protein (DUF58 family)
MSRPRSRFGREPRAKGRRVIASAPLQRGDAKLGDVYVRYQSQLRIAEKWVRASLEQTVRIYPNLDEAKRHSIYLLRSRQIAAGEAPRACAGSAASLRACASTSRATNIATSAGPRPRDAGKLVTRMYQIERSQTVWIVIDSGRLMRARVGVDSASSITR